MALTINMEEPKMVHVLEEDVWTDETKTEVATGSKAAFLLGRKGQKVSLEDAKKFGLIKGGATPENKEAARGEDKGAEKPEEKVEKKVEKKGKGKK